MIFWHVGHLMNWPQTPDVNCIRTLFLPSCARGMTLNLCLDAAPWNCVIQVNSIIEHCGCCRRGHNSMSASHLCMWMTLSRIQHSLAFSFPWDPSTNWKKSLLGRPQEWFSKGDQPVSQDSGFDLTSAMVCHWFPGRELVPRARIAGFWCQSGTVGSKRAGERHVILFWIFFCVVCILFW